MKSVWKILLRLQTYPQKSTFMQISFRSFFTLYRNDLNDILSVIQSKYFYFVYLKCLLSFFVESLQKKSHDQQKTIDLEVNRTLNGIKHVIEEQINQSNHEM